MSGPREGGCSCGAVRYRLTSDPLLRRMSPRFESRVQARGRGDGRPFQRPVAAFDVLAVRATVPELASANL